jgi:hypothetical protein
MAIRAVTAVNTARSIRLLNITVRKSLPGMTCLMLRHFGTSTRLNDDSSALFDYYDLRDAVLLECFFVDLEP